MDGGGPIRHQVTAHTQCAVAVIHAQEFAIRIIVGVMTGGALDTSGGIQADLVGKRVRVRQSSMVKGELAVITEGDRMIVG
jgi:hypothetical protein